jgi:hypothetical protein
MENIYIFQDPNCCLFKDTIINFNKNSYIVSLNGTIIGHFNLMSHFLNLEDCIAVEYELLPNFRNHKFGNTFYQIIETFISTNFDYNQLVLFIKYDNISSKHIALKQGFTINFEYAELMNQNGEMTNYSPFTKVLKKQKV